MPTTTPSRHRARRYDTGRVNGSASADWRLARRGAARGRGGARALARYTDALGRRREVVVRPAHEGSALVIDRDAATRGDRRLLAHLAADEPPANAALVCADFLARSRQEPCRCREVTREDFEKEPLEEESALAHCGDAELLDPRDGCRYRLEPLQGRTSISQLRWCRPTAASDRLRPLSVREVVARLESYEPALAATRDALALHRASTSVSTTVLRAELARVQASPIVLNRGLREATLKVLRREHLSMSEIAMRCGRVKVDSYGNQSGETSWLARRLGMLPEAGQGTPTPWIHSDVLALIARRGLSISPREVEL
jgi:hypothetical protein